jgi:hypothetical protein
MARVVIEREPRQVSGRWVKPGEECTIPDGLARALENKGLCLIVRAVSVDEVETKTKPRPAQKKRAPKKGKS